MNDQRQVFLELLDRSDEWELRDEWIARFDGDLERAASLKDSRERTAREECEETQRYCHHMRPRWHPDEGRYYCSDCGLRSEATTTAIGPTVVAPPPDHSRGLRYVHEKPVLHAVAFMRGAREDEGHDDTLISTACGYVGWVRTQYVAPVAWGGETCEHCPGANL
jgi:hypothetical protein